jgi:GNAT superfamily N-acetyltransferase
LSCTRVRDAETLETWLDVFCTGFNIPDAGRKVWSDAFSLFGFGPHAMWRQYLGTLDGVPVATSALCVGETIAGVYHVVTAPDARGRGVGAAITAAAMEDAKAAGRSMITLQASEMAVSVYRSLGFVDCGDLELYDWRPEY